MEQIYNLHSIVRRRSIGASSILQQPQTPVRRQTLQRIPVRDKVLRSRPLSRQRWVHQLEQLWIMQQIMWRWIPDPNKDMHQPRPSLQRHRMRRISIPIATLQQPELPNQRRMVRVRKLRFMQQRVRIRNQDKEPHMHQPCSTIRRSKLLWIFHKLHLLQHQPLRYKVRCRGSCQIPAEIIRKQQRKQRYGQYNPDITPKQIYWSLLQHHGLQPGRWI